MKRRGGIVWLAIFLGTVCVLSTRQSLASDDCIDDTIWVGSGDAVPIGVTEPTWVVLIGRIDGVYRLELSGDEGMIFEMWTLESNDICYTNERLLYEGNLSQGPWSVTWTNPTFHGVGILLTPPRMSPVPMTLFDYQEVALPPSEDVLIVPAAAHTTGAMGEFFQTDLEIYNHNGVDADVDVRFIRSTGEWSISHGWRIQPYGVLLLEDVVGQHLQYPGESGAIWIEGVGHGRLSAVSRTYAMGDNGTFGQFIPALQWDMAMGRGSKGAVRHVLHLSKSEVARSNVGFVEILGLEAILDLEMMDRSGVVVGTRRVTLPGRSHRQINDIFEFMGVEGGDNASLRVTVVTEARVHAYGSVVDNMSSDPVFVRGQVSDWEFSYTEANDELLIPAAAATDGAYGTRWRTDLRVLPVDEGTSSVEVTFVPADGSPPVSGTFDFVGSGQLAVDDVVTSLGATGNGHLWLFSHGGEMLATSRTYTRGDSGSYGQFIPAAWVLDDPAHGMILGLRGSEHFRSNIGLLSLRSEPVNVVLRLLSAANEELGRTTSSLPPGRRVQINDIFGMIGVPACGVCRLEYETADGDRDVYVHGSVIDNRSGDAIFLPPIHIDY